MAYIASYYQQTSEVQHTYIFQGNQASASVCTETIKLELWKKINK